MASHDHCRVGHSLSTPAFEFISINNSCLSMLEVASDSGRYVLYDKHPASTVHRLWLHPVGQFYTGPALDFCCLLGNGNLEHDCNGTEMDQHFRLHMSRDTYCFKPPHTQLDYLPPALASLPYTDSTAATSRTVSHLHPNAEP